MKRTRFLLLFFGLLAAFEVALLVPAVDTHVIKPVTRQIATVSGGFLNLIGENVRVTGTVIAGKCFAADLKNGCNGVEATVFLVAAILAFPAATLRERFTVAMGGAAAIQFANLIRVVSLYLLGCYRRSWFEMFHLAVWQSLIFALAVAVFMIWTRRVTAAHAR